MAIGRVPSLPWAVWAVPALASAAAYDVEARTEAQAYTIAARSPDAGRALFRRRLVEILDLAAFEIVPGEDAGLSLQLRFDADFSVNQAQAVGLDGVSRDRLQLVAGALHWNGIAGGRVDVEAGRVTALDPVSLFRFDGGRVALRPVPWMAVSAYGGLRVSGASWLASPTLAPDGTRDSDRRRIAAGVPVYPCPGVPTRLCADATLDDPAPAFGARISLLRLPGGFLSGADLEYRRTIRAGDVLEEELLGGARYRRGAWSGDAAGEWDLYVRRLAALRVAARWAPLPWLSLSAEGIHSHPVFSADSIWNLFVTAPSREARLRADVAPAGWPVRLWAAGGAKRYAAADFFSSDLPEESAWEPFGAMGASADVGRTRLSGDASLRGGVEGTQAWITAVGRHALGWVEVEGRATVVRIDDKVAPKNSGTFPALALLVSGRLERRAQLALLLEDSAPRWERSDVRLFAFLTLGADWDTRLR